MKQFKKAAIVMAIVPAFVFVGCAPSEQPVAAQGEVIQSENGAYSQDTLNKAYEDAKAKGYTGTIEEFAALVQLHQTNPAAAQQQAADSGFSGMEMLMAGAAGAALGHMLANRSVDRDRSSSSFVGSGGTAATTAALAANQNASRATSTAAKASTATVSRGGFGGAVSAGG